MVICSSFVIAKRKDATHYDLSGESFQLTGVTADQVYVFDDSVVITEGMELSHDLIAQSLPLDRFVSVSAEEALPNAIGLLLRLAVADGRVTDSQGRTVDFKNTIIIMTSNLGSSIILDLSLIHI